MSDRKAGEYTPRNGSCAAVVLEVMSDGKERTSPEITNAVKEKLGAEFKAVTLYQAMTKLTSRQVIASVKDKPGNWVLISNNWTVKRSPLASAVQAASLSLA